jgi:hypothetical protein
MKSLLRLSLLLITSVFTRGAEINVNSDPVSWENIRIEEGKIFLDGVFSVTLPKGGSWLKRGSGIGPTGSAMNLWEFRDATSPGQGLLGIIDVDINKVPVMERGVFTSSIAKSLRSVGIAAMQRKGYSLTHFNIEDFKGKWPFSVKAVSRFIRGEDSQLNTTYFFPSQRLYIIGYEGPSDDEPSWFLEALRSLKIEE